MIVPLNHNSGGNPIDAIWGKDRPAFPKEAVRVHPLKYAGETVQDKLHKVTGRQTVNGKGDSRRVLLLGDHDVPSRMTPRDVQATTGFT